MYISVFTVLLDHLSALAGAQSHLLTFLDATEMKLLHQMPETRSKCAEAVRGQEITFSFTIYAAQCDLLQ